MIFPLKYRFNHDLDSALRTVEHAAIIRNKFFLRSLYEQWYQNFIREIPDLETKNVLELGSGGGFFKEIAPTVITSDYLNLPDQDFCFSALDMPFDDQSLDAIMMIDTFHHLPDVKLFLREVQRTLKKGGKLIMTEPANSRWGSFIYRNFHHEPFDPSAGWIISGSGPLSGANGALPWIVFERDRKIFEESFPDLKIILVQYHTPFLYLVSGGLSYRQIFPNWTYRLWKQIDRSINQISSQFSMFCTIVLLKD